MSQRKNKTRRARKGKPRSGKLPAKNSAIAPAKMEPVQLAPPRPRIRLRAAMRAAGLDEWKIGWNLNANVDALSESKTVSGRKLLLDYLKEAIRHLDPASTAAATAQEPSTVEIVHQVARPDRGAHDS